MLEELTSRALGCDIDVTSAGIGVWKSGELGYHGLWFVEIPRTFTFKVSWSQSGTRSNIIYMLHDLAGKMIFFARDIMSSGGMLPDVVLSKE